MSKNINRTGHAHKKLSQIMEIEQNTTIEILDKQNLPIRVLEINELDEESLSALMMQMFLETILFNFSIFLETAITLYPLIERSMAVSLPTPLLAPVTIAYFKFFPCTF